MKIAKKNSQPDNTKTAIKSTTDDKYSECRKYIRSAIDALGPIAKDDVLARETIANLGVVLFDLD